MRVNREIRAARVRLIDHDGTQVGIVTIQEALKRAEDESLDLVEIVPAANPPVCKVMNYGKFRYEQTRRGRESKKQQHQTKIKEIKVKPNIDPNDLSTKTRHAREFIEKGHKVKITCSFRGREMLHPENGERIIRQLCTELEEIASPESTPLRAGRFLTVVVSPIAKKRREASSSPSES